ncbi:gamma-tubulin complex component 5 [Marchantia polymorpha subsp. ruderalis]|uniref:Gamma-tubulin complex component n=1 Tax=Marchantia polymorpha TaxID=3197 RepID=A0A2R6XH12_MARPO|nr:hypothetical protein MARPO_0015s0183 [Marchantia polymorpha]PTQ45403.1 hypothetical protein MARPO_0015s0183 [Marchantia polymorpha]BBN01636.1 hypothetical protein Mp_2g08990 [Marchantia polymorpha subsp. ruderalis]BBN01637.1 hypothetical protein Mp_2g08990 [Marchantia polymorpha subsp. ruderalis]|eukprot:PTQ45402.1 hypothetical protein MARPO_0015s0183 [Marchantia polymorpha]
MGLALDAEVMGHTLEPQEIGERRSATLIEHITSLRARNLPFAAPKHTSQTTEAALVRDVLQVLQGYPTYRLPWDEELQHFHVRNGIHVADLSQSSLYNILQMFTRAATSLRRVELFVRGVVKDTTDSWLKPMSQAHPTLEAFANAVFMRLECLRKAALEKELEAAEGSTRVTLLNLYANLSRVFAGAEFLEHIINVAIPEPDRLFGSKVSAAELATHILSALYRELDAFCLLQDGEEDAYGTVLLLLVGCIRPMIESLDAWLQEGVLSDPAGELFFYEDDSVSIEDSAFWETHFRMRNQSAFSEQESRFNSPFQSPGSHRDSSFTALESTSPGGSSRAFSGQKFLNTSIDSISSLQGDALQYMVCPTFLKPLGKAILSAGKSLQLLQHARRDSAEGNLESTHDTSGLSKVPSHILPDGFSSLVQNLGKEFSELEGCSTIDSHITKPSDGCDTPFEEKHSLYEQFCASLLNLVGDSSSNVVHQVFTIVSEASKERTSVSNQVNVSSSRDESLRVKLESTEPLKPRGSESNQRPFDEEFEQGNHERNHVREFENLPEISYPPTTVCGSDLHIACSSTLAPGEKDGVCAVKSFGTTLILSHRTEVPRESVLKGLVNIAGYCQLSSLDDSQLRGAIFKSCVSETSSISRGHKEFSVGYGDIYNANGCRNSLQYDIYEGGEASLPTSTDFNSGLGCGKLLLVHERQNLAAIEKLLPFPTMLPHFREKCHIAEQLPLLTANRKAVRVLERLQSGALKTTPSPIVLFQECLTSSIQRQVDRVGHQLLAKLMGEWRLMEELALLRAIYLVGSGDLLQQFASVLFNKLDRGEPWDDFYELNTMLQESVRSSSHGVAIPALDSLVATVLPRSTSTAERGSASSPGPLHIGGRAPSFGIDTLDSLFFTYKVAWPLELIIDQSAIKKYNQVMVFLLKVKRAKHALDKACRWTWKNGVGDAALHKQRLLLQQKLMHFVNTLHQYVMDRVLYSAWVELCEGMSSARSLDEVKSCHDSYLVSIQRQCLVAPDKLWTLIAGRVKTILGLALNYYSIQRVLCDGVGASAVSARCQLEIERVEKQFDECMVFLMRVLSFRLNVGHFPHLADLVTRINYNYYYMTEDGQLSTPVPDAHALTARRATRRL